MRRSLNCKACLAEAGAAVTVADRYLPLRVKQVVAETTDATCLARVVEGCVQMAANAVPASSVVRVVYEQ